MPSSKADFLDSPNLYAASDLSDAALGGRLQIDGDQFIDAYGRSLSLRGFNVAGASKVPTEPNGFTHLWDGDTFYRHRTVTFLGRPFPLEEAPLHFQRLQAWGMPLIRLMVTWESIAHAGPNHKTDIDLEYIHYLRKLIELMPAYGLKCFICAHQDVWSRYCGGSGAPGWTFEAAGLNMEAFHDTGAAYIHGQDLARRLQAPPNEREPSGPFVWPSGYQKLAASTMATLFWAGEALAPKLTCLRSSLDGKGQEENVSIQQFLQEACIEAFGRLADEVGHLEACVGFEPMNEPDRGLVNLKSFHGWNYNTDLHIGFYPSLLQALALGSGFAQKVPYYVKSWPFPTRMSHRTVFDPRGCSAWLPKGNSTPAAVDRPRGLGECVWRYHGVWAWHKHNKSPVVLQPNYFDYDHRPGREKHRIEWYRDCYAPFVLKFSERVSRGFKHHLSFVEPLPNQFMPPWGLGETQQPDCQQHDLNGGVPAISLPRPRNLVYAPHFYDLNVLFSKSYNYMSANVQGLARGMFVLRALYFGSSGLRRNYARQLSNLVQHALKFLRPVPILIGEVGIPFDINNRRALQTGDYSKQRELLHNLIAAMEDNMVGYTLWNYNPVNTIEHGDGWNDEDFSVLTSHPYVADICNKGFEEDKVYRGGRCLDVVIRPYAAKVAGKPIRSNWDPQTLQFEFEWEYSVAVAPNQHLQEEKRRLTEIFLPAYHYAAHDLVIRVSSGDTFAVDAKKQSLYVLSEPDTMVGTKHWVTVSIRDVDQHIKQSSKNRPSDSFGTGSSVLTDTWFSSFPHVTTIGAMIIVLLAATLMYSQRRLKADGMFSPAAPELRDTFETDH